jgi:hypothetical protein
MRIILGSIAAAALFTTAAIADEDIMAGRYGNTTITTDANGVTSKIHYKADGTFDGTQGSAAFAGTWKLDGTGKICLTSNPAIPNTPNPVCTPIFAHKVGDSWTAGPYKISLVQGIQ